MVLQILMRIIFSMRMMWSTSTIRNQTPWKIFEDHLSYIVTFIAPPLPGEGTRLSKQGVWRPLLSYFHIDIFKCKTILCIKSYRTKNKQNKQTTSVILAKTEARDTRTKFVHSGRIFLGDGNHNSLFSLISNPAFQKGTIQNCS